LIEDDREDNWDEQRKIDESKKIEELQEKNKGIVDRAYADFFTSESGQIVWADLCVHFLPEIPASIAPGQMLDVNATLVSLGQHNVLKYILSNSIEHEYGNISKQRQEQLNVRNRANNIGG